VLGGEIVELHLARELPLQEFCDLFVAQFPILLDFLPQRERKSAALLTNVFFVTRGDNPAKILHPSDIVRDEDFLQKRTKQSCRT